MVVSLNHRLDVYFLLSSSFFRGICRNNSNLLRLFNNYIDLYFDLLFFFRLLNILRYHHLLRIWVNYFSEILSFSQLLFLWSLWICFNYFLYIGLKLLFLNSFLCYLPFWSSSLSWHFWNISFIRLMVLYP